MNNGRVELKDQNYTKSSLFTDDELLNSKEDIPVNSIYEENPVQIKFFCSKNINLIQKMIIKSVYSQSNGKHIIKDQDETTLKIVMKSIYLQHGKNLRVDINKQIIDLNNLVLDYCVPNILSNIEMYLHYKRDITQLPVPLNRPKYISDSGTRTNNNLIH